MAERYTVFAPVVARAWPSRRTLVVALVALVALAACASACSASPVAAPRSTAPETAPSAARRATTGEVVPFECAMLHCAPDRYCEHFLGGAFSDETWVTCKPFPERCANDHSCACLTPRRSAGDETCHEGAGQLEVRRWAS